MNKARSGPVLPTLTHFADGTAALGEVIKSALSDFAAPQIDTHREESVFPDGIVSSSTLTGLDAVRLPSRQGGAWIYVRSEIGLVTEELSLQPSITVCRTPAKFF